jgi:outer membrane protein OmpA-like peptidoglycan-associated protein
MRFELLIAICFAGLAAQDAIAADTPPAPSSGVTVNFGALPIPLPRHKPSQEEMRARLVPMPRPKPSQEAAAATIPLPRPKPKPTAVAAATKTPATKTPEVGTEASPAQATALSTPQTATAIAEALRGSTTTTPAAPGSRTVNPLEGFSVLTQVKFSGGGSELSDDYKAALDALATRFLANDERVRLAAFSGQVGDISSQAHRLSLRRAIAVRAYLASKGVPVSRVDVLAFGPPPHGDSDRVDVLVRAT